MAQLILLGQGPSRHNCPFGTETWASLSVLSHKEYENAPIDKVFCFDKPEMKADELEGLKVAVARNITVVSYDWMDKWGTGERFVTEYYPLKALQEKFDTYYFKNDLSYMLAYAIHLGYKDLLLWGVDQGGGRKEDLWTYEMARAYVMFWLGIATGMGIKWQLAPDSILLRDN